MSAPSRQLPNPDQWKAAIASGRLGPLKACIQALPNGLPVDAMLGSDLLLVAVIKHEESARLKNTGERLQPVSASAFRSQLAFLLNEGLDPNATDTVGWTALLEACGSGSLGSVRRLLAAGAHVSATPPGRTTPLHQAVLAEHVQVVHLLIEAGSSLNALDSERRTPLHFAAWAVHRPLLSALYKAGADWSLKDAKDRTAADVIQINDVNLADWWRHRPGRDALIQTLDAAPMVEKKSRPRF